MQERGRDKGAHWQAMRRVIATTVSLVLVCHGDAFSAAGPPLLPRNAAGAAVRPPSAYVWRTAYGSRGAEAEACRVERLVGGKALTPGSALSRGTARLTLLQANNNEVAGPKNEGGGGEGKQADFLQRMADMPVLGIFVRFARWIAALFRSILIARMTVLLQAMAQVGTALLDPQRRLSAPPGQGIREAAPGDSSVQAATAAASDAADAIAGARATQVEGKAGGLGWKPVTSSDMAFQAFWNQMDTMSTSPSIQTELALLQAESARQRTIQEEVLAQTSGIQLSVLDFVEHGGQPPSVEALTAWLEIRDIDTALWGTGEAKTVQVRGGDRQGEEEGVFVWGGGQRGSIVCVCVCVCV